MIDNCTQEPIAIVGMGCRFPGGVNNPHDFWQLLLSRRDAVADVPTERWDLRQHYHPNPDQPGKTYQHHGAFLQDIDQFDAAFFGLSATEASRMDPQQRLLLEVSYEACEDAGIPQKHMRGSSTGVFIGITAPEYNHGQSDSMQINAYTNAGVAPSIAANRLSYYFDWRGPSLSIDTACSSALVALHLACQSLLQGECVQALAGAVHLLIDSVTNIGFSKAQMLSPSGRCHTFDAEADGYVRGEGAGVVLLKRLSQAQADGDSIYAVIRSTAVNQDGHTSSLHYPSQEAQETLLREIYHKADVDLARVRYIEAHGTGTIVGDQVECQALGAVFAETHPPKHPLRIGSVKTNIGHLEVASGIASLIKTVLIVQQQQIPANLHFQRPNPHIPFQALHLQVQTENETLIDERGPVIAGVSSFGFGGTNAHAILQAYSPAVVEMTIPTQCAYMLPLSARTPQALYDLAQAYHAFLASEQAPPFSDICFTASCHRSHHQERLTLVAASSAEAREQLTAYLLLPGDARPSAQQHGKPGDTAIAFVFSGNGSQWWGMGRALLQHHTLYRSVIERCDQHWQALAGWSLVEELLKDEQTSRIAQTEIAQPLLFALQIALVELWKDWGITPRAVIGHSVGEIAAAYVAGNLSFEDALDIVYHRSRLQERTKGNGTMVAVGISPQQAEELIAPFAPEVALAAINTPHSVTLAGDETLLHQLIEPLAQEDTFCRFLKLRYAFHSAQMDPLHDELLHALRHLNPREGQIDFFSTVTGEKLSGTACDASYWWHNVRQPVQFAAGIERIVEAGITTFLEIGPHPVLSLYMQECLGEHDGGVFASLRRGDNDLRQLLSSLGDLYTHGYDVDWERVVPQGNQIRLPNYPWQREHYWYDEVLMIGRRPRGCAVHPLLGFALPTALPMWEQQLDTPDLAYLFDHQVEGTALFPAAGYNELALAAAEQSFGTRNVIIEQMQIEAPLFLRQYQPPRFQTSIQAGDVTILALTDAQEGWTRCASAHIVPQSTSPAHTVDVSGLRARCPQTITTADFYDACQRRGFQYGPAFQLVQQVWIGEQEALGLVRLPAITDALSKTYALHPALLDGCLQIAIGLSLQETGGMMAQNTYVPVGFERLRFYGEPITSSSVYCHVRLTNCDLRQMGADYCICDEAGTLLAEIRGMRLLASLQSVHAAREEADGLLYEERWYPEPLQMQSESIHMASEARHQQTWLLLADDGGVAKQLGERLHDQKLIWLKCGTAYQRVDATHFIARPQHAADIQTVLMTLRQEGSTPTQIAYLWGLDQLDTETLHACVNRSCLSLLRLVQTLAAFEWKARLWIMTSGVQHGVLIEGQPRETQDRACKIALAPLYGLARVVVNEHPDLSPTIIDLGSPVSQAYRVEELDACADELRVQADVSEVCLRGNRRFLNRITRAPLTQHFPSDSLSDQPDLTFRLTLDAPGLLSNLSWRTVPKRQPGPGEVAIAVEATGLNFKDVALALGLIAPGAHAEASGEIALGLECAGRIAALGSGVTDFQIGEEVIALGGSCYSPWLVVDARWVARKPAQFSMQEAAGLLCVFLTAYYGLHELAHIRPGERVLLHGATGGIGLAAIQIVQQAGGEVFATAGSPEKRAYLRTLGVQHVFDSRSLSFADEIMRITQGEGVDIVLNSVAGEVAAQSLKILRSFGRFLEIGKRDFEENTLLGLRPFERCLAYFSIDLLRMLHEAPDFTSRLMRELMEHFALGHYTSLPYQLYQPDQIVDAFRFMQQSRHIGKIVIQMQGQRVPVVHYPQFPEMRLREDASYLITGGLGGFGLATADFLVQRGARHLILASRRGQTDPEDAPIIERFRQAGVHVQTERLDVTNEQEVEKLLSHIEHSMPPLRGIIHSAMVLSDQLVVDMDEQSWERALTPKMLGAWYLHRHSLHLPLDFFVLYSSSSVILGNSVQGNYVAGNAFLEALTRYRRARGLPALAISWTALAQVGCVARMHVTANYLQHMGFHYVEPQEALGLLEKVLQEQRPQVTVARINWDTLIGYSPHPASNMRWSHLCSQGQDSSTHVQGKLRDVRTSLRMMSEEERQSAILTTLQQLLKQIIGGAASFDPHCSLKELGIDSLMAMEFRNSLRRNLDVDIPPMQLLKMRNLADLMEWINRHIEETQRVEQHIKQSELALMPARIQ